MHIHDDYWDTPDFFLLKQEMGLRIDQQGDQLLQTCKSTQPAQQGVHARLEYETTLDQALPQLSALPSALFKASKNNNKFKRCCIHFPA